MSQIMRSTVHTARVTKMRNTFKFHLIDSKSKKKKKKKSFEKRRCRREDNNNTMDLKEMLYRKLTKFS